MNVLVIEDDPDVAAYLMLVLKHLGHRPLMAVDYASAVQLLERSDVAIVDYHLERELGVDVAELLRKYRPELPLIFATARSETRDDPAVAALEAEVVLKPFVKVDLQRALGATGL